MNKMPPLKVFSSWILYSRRSTSRPTVLHTKSRPAALMILVALIAMISFPSSSASSLTGLLGGHNPGLIATSSNGFNSTNAARQPFRASLRADSQDKQPATGELHIARKAHTATTLSDGK